MRSCKRGNAEAFVFGVGTNGTQSMFERCATFSLSSWRKGLRSTKKGKRRVLNQKERKHWN